VAEHVRPSVVEEHEVNRGVAGLVRAA
jgi:hypothetical protein